MFIYASLSELAENQNLISHSAPLIGSVISLAAVGGLLGFVGAEGTASARSGSRFFQPKYAGKGLVKPV